MYILIIFILCIDLLIQSFQLSTMLKMTSLLVPFNVKLSPYCRYFDNRKKNGCRLLSNTAKFRVVKKEALLTAFEVILYEGGILSFHAGFNLLENK